MSHLPVPCRPGFIVTPHPYNRHLALYPAFALGLVYALSSPTQTEQTVRLICDEVLGPGAADKACHHSAIEDRASDLLKYVSLCGSGVMILVGGSYGVLADYAGRKLPWACMFLSALVGVVPNLLVDHGGWFKVRLT